MFDDLFGEFMGGKRARRQNRGGDLRYNLEITLEEAFTGRTAQIKVPSAVACEACGGTGAEAGTKPEQCPTCSGIGKVRAQQGFFTIERTCPQLPRHRAASSAIRARPARARAMCRRSARWRSIFRRASKKARASGLSGEGQAGMNGGPPGDLYIFISVTPHPIFQRDGHDLYCRAPVSFVTAALGGAIEVPTLDGGRAKVTIPEGTQIRPPVPHARQRHAGAARRRHARRSLCRGRGGNAGEADQEAERIAARLRSRKARPGAQPESEGFFAKVKEFWNSAD